MHILKETDLRQWCKSAGYTGADDLPAMKSWLETQYDAIEIDGKEVALKDCQLEAPAKKVLPVTMQQPVEDLDAKLKAMVDERMRLAGHQPEVKRPRLVNPEPEVKSVKSVEQAMYENSIAKGRARFASYESAKAFQLWMAGNIHAARNNPEAYAGAVKAYRDFTDRVWGKAYASNSQSNGRAHDVLPGAERRGDRQHRHLRQRAAHRQDRRRVLHRVDADAPGLRPPLCGPHDGGDGVLHRHRGGQRGSRR
jgi:hypothetical protein